MGSPSSAAVIAGTAPCAPGAVMTIFGAGGDLTKRLLVPALYNLAKARLLHPDFKVLGVDHAAGDDASFRSQLEQFLKAMASSQNSEFGAGEIDASARSWLCARLFYQTADFEEGAGIRQLYAAGSAGPRQADQLLARGGRAWQSIGREP